MRVMIFACIYPSFQNKCTHGWTTHVPHVPPLCPLQAQHVNVEWDATSGQWVMPYRGMTKVFQVKTELQLLDPRNS